MQTLNIALLALLLVNIVPVDNSTAAPSLIDFDIPIINYHRFVSDDVEYSTYMKRRIGDFRRDLERLYDAGYSLISLDELIDGNYQLPPGRRPLVISIDDAYFADQLWLDPETGEPSPQCGIGVLWQFYHEYPDFGFKVAMFANYGDKLYGNVYRYGWWYVGDGWKRALTDAIIWGIDHGVMPYNHLWTHPLLTVTKYEHIWEQIDQNDRRLYTMLWEAGRRDLIDLICKSNFIALPYGIWPESQAGRDLLISYKEPWRDNPVRGIFESGYEYMPEYANPRAQAFDPYHIPRMAGVQAAIDAIVERGSK